MATLRARGSERGATAVVVALVVAALVGVLALAINVGHLLAVRGELQNAVDSAAVAGTMRLNGTPEGVAAARAAASAFASAHVTDSAPSERVAASIIELGEWIRANRSFAVGADARDVNAVRVVSRQPEPVWMGWFLGRGFGQAEAAVGAEAIAVGGGLSEAPCADLPYVLRRGCAADRCTLPTDVPEYAGGHYYVALTGSTVDNAGTTVLLPSSAGSTSLMCELLQNPGYCEEERPGDPPGVGDRIETDNGENGLSANCSSDGDDVPVDDGKVCEDILSAMVNRGSPARIPIVQFDGESDTHCDPRVDRWGEDAEIVGFASVKVVFVQCDEKRPEDAAADASLTPSQIEAMRGSCWTPEGDRTKKCVVLELRCNVKDGESNAPGGAWFGTGPVMPRLTR